MIWEYWCILKGPARTIRCPLKSDSGFGPPAQIEGTIQDAIANIDGFLQQFTTKTPWGIEIVGLEILPKGYGDKVQHPMDDDGGIQIEQKPAV